MFESACAHMFLAGTNIIGSDSDSESGAVIEPEVNCKQQRQKKEMENNKVRVDSSAKDFSPTLSPLSTSLSISLHSFGSPFCLSVKQGLW